MKNILVIENILEKNQKNLKKYCCKTEKYSKIIFKKWKNEEKVWKLRKK